MNVYPSLPPSIPSPPPSKEKSLPSCNKRLDISHYTTLSLLVLKGHTSTTFVRVRVYNLLELTEVDKLLGVKLYGPITELKLLLRVENKTNESVSNQFCNLAVWSDNRTLAAPTGRKSNSTICLAIIFSSRARSLKAD